MTNSNTTAKKLYKVFVQKYNPDTEDELKSSATKLNISIDEAAHRVDVFMDVNRKTLKGAYKVFIKAIEQAVADGALDKKVAEFAYFADDINDIDFAGKDYFIANDNVDNSFAYGIDDNGDNGYYFWFWTLTEAAEETAEVNSDAKEETTMTITTKTAKNGATLYYLNGKRISREKAEQLERDARRKAFMKEIRETINDILDEYEAKCGIVHIETEGYTATVRQRFYQYAADVSRIYSNIDDAINAVRYFADNPIERFADYCREGDVTTTERVERFVFNTTKYFTYSNYYSHNQFKYTAAYFGEAGNDESAFDYLPALDELNDVDIDDTEETAEEIADAKPTLTRSQLQKMIDGVVAEREEYYDALDEAEADEEVPQSHIDYLKDMIKTLGNEYWELVKQYDNAPDDEPPAVPSILSTAIILIRGRGLHCICDSDILPHRR